MVLGFLAVVLFLVADVASLVLLGRAYGGWWVFGALLFAFLAAILTFRAIGPLTAVRVAGRLRRGELPGRELIDALLMAAAGGLFLVPGLVSDALALLLVLPGLRALPRWLLVRWVRGRAVLVHTDAPPPPPAGGNGDALDAEFWRK